MWLSHPRGLQDLAEPDAINDGGVVQPGKGPETKQTSKTIIYICTYVYVKIYIHIAMLGRICEHRGHASTRRLTKLGLQLSAFEALFETLAWPPTLPTGTLGSQNGPVGTFSAYEAVVGTISVNCGILENLPTFLGSFGI